MTTGGIRDSGLSRTKRERERKREREKEKERVGGGSVRTEKPIEWIPTKMNYVCEEREIASKMIEHEMDQIIDMIRILDSWYYIVKDLY